MGSTHQASAAAWGHAMEFAQSSYAAVQLQTPTSAMVERGLLFHIKKKTASKNIASKIG